MKTLLLLSFLFVSFNSSASIKFFIMGKFHANNKKVIAIRRTNKIYYIKREFFDPALQEMIINSKGKDVLIPVDSDFVLQVKTIKK